MTPSCHTSFRLLAHVSLLQYSISSNMLAFRRTLTHVSIGYPCISSSWTQWLKNNNRPNYNQELKRVLSFFVFMGNLVAHVAMASLIYFCFIYTFFFYECLILMTSLTFIALSNTKISYI